MDHEPQVDRLSPQRRRTLIGEVLGRVFAVLACLVLVISAYAFWTITSERQLYYLFSADFRLFLTASALVLGATLVLMAWRPLRGALPAWIAGIGGGGVAMGLFLLGLNTAVGRFLLADFAGPGETQDRLYQSAARAGSANALYMVGVDRLADQGRDVTDGVGTLEQAADLGEVRALGLLVALYGGVSYEGRAVPTDISKACLLYVRLKAAQPGQLHYVLGERIAEAVEDVATRNGFKPDAIFAQPTRETCEAAGQTPASVEVPRLAPEAKRPQPDPISMTRAPAQVMQRPPSQIPLSIQTPQPPKPPPPPPLPPPLPPPQPPVPPPSACFRAGEVQSARFSSPPSPAYPSSAFQQGVSGRVVLRCRVGSGGRLTNCSVVSETPSGWGFGSFALSSAEQARVVRDMDRRQYGCPATEVRFVVEFRDIPPPR